MNAPMRRELPDTMIERHATTLSEIKKLHEDFEAMRQENVNYGRVVDKLTNKCEVLAVEAERWRNDASLYHRKLIRLAAAMEMIGKLSTDAEAIMRSVQEIEDVAEANGDPQAKAIAAVEEALATAGK